MDRAARLDLAVRARLASIRANQVRERTALLDRQYVSVARAIEEYVEQHGRGADPFDDFDTFIGLIVRHGGTDLGWVDVLTATEQYVQRAAATTEAADAARALEEAVGDHRGTVLAWVGCTRRQFDSALESRLNA
jgi:phosphate uptake regulator